MCHSTIHLARTARCVVSGSLLFAIVGCNRNGDAQSLPGRAAATRPTTTLTSAIPPTLDKGWCGGHGVPESVCTRCNSSLIETFKQAGDWCAEHGLPESQCLVCHPELEAEWQTLDPARQQDDSQHAESGDETGLPADAERTPWCSEHGVPESVCTRCNAKLIDDFKKAGDWCAEHGLPESQCTLCNPEVRPKWAAMRPPVTSATLDADRGISLERVPRLLSGESDPLCQIDNLRVRFVGPDIVRKAGITVERAQRRSISAAVELPAEVQFNATQMTRITPRVPGVVRQVVAQVGDLVQPGDALCVLDSVLLGEAKSQYIQATQDLRLASVDLERETTIARGVGRMLEVCTPVAAADAVRDALAASPVGESKARLLRAHAELQLARAEAARQNRLIEKSLSSTRDHQAAQSALAAAEAHFVALREEIAFDIERRRLAAERSAEIARNAVDAAERKLHILGLSHEEIRRIGTGEDERLTHYELRGPVAGRLIECDVAAGESVDTDDVLFVAVDTSTMWLVADMFERDLPRVFVGAPVFFTVDGLPGAGFAGAVTWISSQVDEHTRTVRLRADLPNPDGLLRARMFGRARIVLHDGADVLTVPVQSVQTDGCCQLVFVQESETAFLPRKVTLGCASNGFVEVIKGLAEGDMVVAAGSFLMKTEILKSNIGAGCCEVDPGR